MEKDTEIIRTSLRMNKKLYDKLDAAATEHGLTMHAEILARLEASFERKPFSLADLYDDASWNEPELSRDLLTLVRAILRMTPDEKREADEMAKSIRSSLHEAKSKSPKP